MQDTENEEEGHEKAGKVEALWNFHGRKQHVDDIHSLSIKRGKMPTLERYIRMRREKAVGGGKNPIVRPRAGRKTPRDNPYSRNFS